MEGHRKIQGHRNVRGGKVGGKVRHSVDNMALLPRDIFLAAFGWGEPEQAVDTRRGAAPKLTCGYRPLSTIHTTYYSSYKDLSLTKTVERALSCEVPM